MPLDSAADAPGFKAKGNEFFKAKDYGNAIEWYTKAVNADPANRVYYSNRAAAYTAQKNWELAKTDGELCIRCDPDWNKGYFRLATALQGSKKYCDALKVVNTGLARKTVSDDKNLVNLRDSLTPLAANEAAQAKRGMASNLRLKTEGNEFYKKREFEKAIEKYDAAVADPLTQNGDEVYISCYNNKAGAKQQINDHKGVVEASSMVLEYDESNQKALLRRGLAFEGLERFQLGLNDVRKLLLLQPNVAMANQAQHRMQNALRQQRKMKEAMKSKK
jgi:stress-induced-phosphoprotein 1